MVLAYHPYQWVNEGEEEGTYEHEVDDSLLIDVGTKVLVVTSGEASPDTVVRVHHTRNTIESEPVELELFHVVSQIREEESENFVRAIVEETAAGG
jgi:hypothetical protein